MRKVDPRSAALALFIASVLPAHGNSVATPAVIHDGSDPGALEAQSTIRARWGLFADFMVWSGENWVGGPDRYYLVKVTESSGKREWFDDAIVRYRWDRTDAGLFLVEDLYFRGDAYGRGVRAFWHISPKSGRLTRVEPWQRQMEIEADGTVTGVARLWDARRQINIRLAKEGGDIKVVNFKKDKIWYAFLLSPTSEAEFRTRDAAREEYVQRTAKSSGGGLLGALAGAVVGGALTGGSTEGIVAGARVFGTKDGAAQVYNENIARASAPSATTLPANGGQPSDTPQPFARAYDQLARDRAQGDAARQQERAEQDASRAAEARAFANSPAANQSGQVLATPPVRRTIAPSRPASGAPGAIIVHEDRAAIALEQERKRREAEYAAQQKVYAEQEARNARARAEEERKAREWKPPATTPCGGKGQRTCKARPM